MGYLLLLSLFAGYSWEVEGADFLSEATLGFAESSCDAGGVDFLWEATLGFAESSCEAYRADFLSEAEATLGFAESSCEADVADVLSEVTLSFVESSCDAGGVDFLWEATKGFAESSCEAYSADFLSEAEATLGFAESSCEADVADVLSEVTLSFVESSCEADGVDFLREATLGFAESPCDAGGADGKDLLSQASFDVFRGVSFYFTGSSCDVKDTGFSLLEATLGDGEVMDWSLDFPAFSGVPCFGDVRLLFLGDLQGDSLSESDDELEELDEEDEDELEELDSVLFLGVLLEGCPRSVVERSCHRALHSSGESSSRLSSKLTSESKQMGSPSYFTDFLACCSDFLWFTMTWWLTARYPQQSHGKGGFRVFLDEVAECRCLLSQVVRT